MNYINYCLDFKCCFIEIKRHFCVLYNVLGDHRRLDNAKPDKGIITIKIKTAENEPIKDPVIRLQNFLYCWHIAIQFAEAFPLCAKYTIAAAAEAPAVSTPSIICIKWNYSRNESCINELSRKKKTKKKNYRVQKKQQCPTLCCFLLYNMIYSHW